MVQRHCERSEAIQRPRKQRIPLTQTRASRQTRGTGWRRSARNDGGNECRILQNGRRNGLQWFNVIASAAKQSRGHASNASR